ncbi:hypothetical protein [Helicobacter zhangjianzhongii]|uniref:Uncharacterized protein n=1 Tax=Helicobacter zhangjianzhongii TaxID=2974574 RepID=A0ACC6FUS3_9HELI|nr:MULTISPECIES: hypothetical protein [unclassified Helicobacter]MDL0081054.1 hypothetical protein [Helicobacter sp. CPD2-1]MDL0083043.1 hypothetical protein [Helicobacter sp. XJK30-2]
MLCRADKSARNGRENNARTSKSTARNDTKTPQVKKWILGLELAWKQHDSKNCGGAVVALRDFRVGVTLSGNDCPKITQSAALLAQD